MAKPKKLDEANILDFLAKDTLNTGDNDDPISSQKLEVTLDQLQPYELNPRRTRNPKYDDIKASIESVGLLEPPKITRRHPDDEKYSIRNGGNTRLEVLNDLYNQYTALADNEKDKAKKQLLLDKANSFYRISCVFVPFQDDINALSTHMIENEERSGTIFIERALVVEQYKRLFKEADELEAKESGQNFEYKELSVRVLAERISSLGWQVSYSHISRYNYAATTLIDYIPDALWAGAGHPLANKISALFKAYNIFWKATTQGDDEPDKIESLFYDTLKDFDAEKVNIDAFKQDLDILLSDLTGIDANNLMFEISAILSNSDQSLKYKPTALKENLEAIKERDLALAEEGINPSNHLPPSDQTPSVSILTPSSHQEPQKSPVESTATNPVSAEEQTAIRPSFSVVNDDKNSDAEKESLMQIKTPEQLIQELYQQALVVEGLSPRPMGITLVAPHIAQKYGYEHEGRYVFYEVFEYIEKGTYRLPIYGQHDDDIATMIWWQLFKFSRDFVINNNLSFTKIFINELPSYVINAQNSYPGGHILEAILVWENSILLHPHILKECQKLQMIQSELIQIIQSNPQLS